MKNPSLRVLPALLLCLALAGCNFSNLLDQKQENIPTVESSWGEKIYIGTYTCREVRGQTFYRSLNLPEVPSQVVSLDSDELDFKIRIDGGQGSLDYSLGYTYNARLLVPVITYDDNNIISVDHYNQYYNAQTKSRATGGVDSDGWFQGRWTEVKLTEDFEQKLQSEYTWEFIGAADLVDGLPRLQLCSWYHPMDLADAKAAGTANFADYCIGANYFVCDYYSEDVD
jgi:hypothetical protein